MTDPAPEPAVADNGQPTAEQLAAGAVPMPPAAPAALPAPTDERPELAVAAAFAGGVAVGLLLKRLGR